MRLFAAVSLFFAWSAGAPPDPVKVETPDARIAEALRGFSASDVVGEDAPGRELWLLERHYRYARDWAWLAASWPRVAEGAEALIKSQQRSSVWEHSWAWAGLNGAAYLARESGHAAEAGRYAEQAARLHKTLVVEADSELGRDERDFAVVVWPTRALAPNHRWLAATFDDRWQTLVAATGRYRPISERPRFDVAEAHNRLWMGERARALEMLDYFLSNRPPDSAEIALLARDLFVFEENDSLVFAAGVPADWLAPGRRVAVSGFDTWWGRVAMTIATDERRVEVRLELPAPAPPFELRLPGYRTLEGAAGEGARVTGAKSWLGYPLWRAAAGRVTIRIPR
jgi:hypothetical protein